MCVNPRRLPDGVEVACHECWQCRENRINDWVGRNIAESKTAKASHAVTLTYGRSRAGDADHLRAAILTYSDVQKYLKLLRRHGFPVRYFITGEFGGLKGRAHWHLMLYWQDAVPDHVLDQRFDEPHWPHGISFWTKPEVAAIRYNCKYVQKDMGSDERQGHLAMSKKPPLGAEYFDGLALRYAQQGLAPQTPFYTFPEAKKSDGSLVQFHLADRSLELFLDGYVRHWRALHGARHMPPSELVDNHTDAGSWSDIGVADRLLGQRARERLPDVPKPAVEKCYTWMPRSKIVWNRHLRVWEAPGPSGVDGLYKWVYHPNLKEHAWLRPGAIVAQQ